jgi:dienelactone hydrolase
MHWLDRLAGTFTAMPRFYDPVFADGWGDQPTLSRLRNEALEIAPIPDIDVSWSAPVERHKVRLTRGNFPSPSAELLPPASRLATVLRVDPLVEPEGTCLLMASFNDHGYATRLNLATRLADHGIASLILENPYYGERRPSRGQPLRTVVDFFSMGASAVLEGRAILNILNRELPTPIGVAGYSMGGNIAALVSATMSFPVATAGLAASHSPGPVWTEGLLANAIAWDALGGRQRSKEIAGVLGSASVLNFPPPPHSMTAVLAAPTDDGYIPKTAFEDLHKHWPGSELRWIGGGHASVLLWRKAELAQAIVDSFERLAAEGRNIQSGPTNS